MISDILLSKNLKSTDLYFIFMNPEPKMIDTDWEDIRRDYYINKGIDLRPAEKIKFTVMYSPANGFIWTEKDSLFKIARPLMRSEISNVELSLLNNVDKTRARYINNDQYYLNVFDFLNDTGYTPFKETTQDISQ